MNGFRRLLLGVMLCVPFAVLAETIEEDEVEITEEEIILTIGKVEATESDDIVVEHLPLESEAAAVVAEALLNKAVEENAARRNMRSAELSDRECLATALYHEARGEGERGMLAVAHVIHNRVKSAIFPDSVCDVVLQRAQFSFTADRNPDNIRDWPSYEKILALVIDLVDNDGFQQGKSPIGGALYFHSFRSPNGWQYARAKKFIATLGNHHFFK